MASYGLFLCSIKKIEIFTRGTNSMPFRMRGRARFQVTTKDSVFALYAKRYSIRPLQVLLFSDHISVTDSHASVGFMYEIENVYRGSNPFCCHEAL